MLDPGAIKRIRAGFRVPVDSSHPAAYWIISLDVDSLMPTDEELALLKSYQEFLIEAAYNEHFAERLKRLELPKCVGHNTVVFRKGSHLEGTDNHWFYRRASWINGPTYVPYALSEDYKPHTLRELLDRIQNLVPQKWERWKENNKKVFSAVSDASKR